MNVSAPVSAHLSLTKSSGAAHVELTDAFAALRHGLGADVQGGGPTVCLLNQPACGQRAQISAETVCRHLVQRGRCRDLNTDRLTQQLRDRALPFPCKARARRWQRLAPGDRFGAPTRFHGCSPMRPFKSPSEQ